MFVPWHVIQLLDLASGYPKHAPPRTFTNTHTPTHLHEHTLRKQCQCVKINIPRLLLPRNLASPNIIAWAGFMRELARAFLSPDRPTDGFHSNHTACWLARCQVGRLTRSCSPAQLGWLAWWTVFREPVWPGACATLRPLTRQMHTLGPFVAAANVLRTMDTFSRNAARVRRHVGTPCAVSGGQHTAHC